MYPEIISNYLVHDDDTGEYFEPGDTLESIMYTNENGDETFVKKAHIEEITSTSVTFYYTNNKNEIKTVTVDIGDIIEFET